MADVWYFNGPNESPIDAANATSLFSQIFPEATIDNVLTSLKHDTGLKFEGGIFFSPDERTVEFNGTLNHGETPAYAINLTVGQNFLRFDELERQRALESSGHNLSGHAIFARVVAVAEELGIPDILMIPNRVGAHYWATLGIEPGELSTELRNIGVPPLPEQLRQRLAKISPPSSSVLSSERTAEIETLIGRMECGEAGCLQQIARLGDRVPAPTDPVGMIVHQYYPGDQVVVRADHAGETSLGVRLLMGTSWSTTLPTEEAGRLLLTGQTRSNKLVTGAPETAAAITDINPAALPLTQHQAPDAPQPTYRPERPRSI